MSSIALCVNQQGAGRVSLLVVTSEFCWDSAENLHPAVNKAGSAHQFDQVAFYLEPLFEEGWNRCGVTAHDVDPDTIGARKGEGCWSFTLPGLCNFAIIDAIANDDSFKHMPCWFWFQNQCIGLMLAFGKLEIFRVAIGSPGNLFQIFETPQQHMILLLMLKLMLKVLVSGVLVFFLSA